MQLRDYQESAIRYCYAALRGGNSNPCIVLPTGTGKSLVIAQIIKDAVERKGLRCVVLAHVKELLEQNANEIKALCPELDVGLYSAGLKKREHESQVVVAGIQSVYNKSSKLGDFGLIIIDEAHLIPPDGEGMYQTFLNASMTRNPKTRIIGLTATPYRLKSGMICGPENILNEVCYDYNIADAIADGWLSPLIGKGSSIKADMSNVHMRGGEFIEGEAQEAFNQTALVNAAVGEFLELTRERKSVLVFTCGVEHCRAVAETIERFGKCEAGVITGETQSAERAELIERFKGNAIKNMFGVEKPPLKYLVNVNVLTTGFNAPNVDAVILLRPTASPGLLVQMIGRGTRLFPGKENCLVLDYGENIMRHGTIDSIKSCFRKKKKSEKPEEEEADKIRECPKCNFIITEKLRECPTCGEQLVEERVPTHKTQADETEIIGGMVEEREIDVSEVCYYVHTKKGNEDGPKTIRVEYYSGLGMLECRQWLCPEHSGFARAKFEAWWEAMSNAPIPDNCLDFICLKEEGALAEIKKIWTRKMKGDKFETIYKTETDEIPEWGDVTFNGVEYHADEIPF